jgi:hypothetical protein
MSGVCPRSVLTLDIPPLAHAGLLDLSLGIYCMSFRGTQRILTVAVVRACAEQAPKRVALAPHMLPKFVTPDHSGHVARSRPSLAATPSLFDTPAPPLFVAIAVSAAVVPPFFFPSSLTKRFILSTAQQAAGP